MTTATAVKRSHTPSIQIGNRSQLVSVWKWNGFDWKCFCKSKQFWQVEINLSFNSFPVLAFPVECNPNTLSDVLYAHFEQDCTQSNTCPLDDVLEQDYTQSNTYPLEQPTAKPATRLEAYADPSDPKTTIVYSFSPKRVAPAKYSVKQFSSKADAVYGCTCPAGIHGKNCKHVDLAKTTLRSKLKREPVKVFKDRRNIDGYWLAYYGITQGKFLGRVQADTLAEAKAKANQLADRYFLYCRNISF